MVNAQSRADSYGLMFELVCRNFSFYPNVATELHILQEF
jgi:hypothetical protein